MRALDPLSFVELGGRVCLRVRGLLRGRRCLLRFRLGLTDTAASHIEALRKLSFLGLWIQHFLGNLTGGSVHLLFRFALSLFFFELSLHYVYIALVNVGQNSRENSDAVDYRVPALANYIVSERCKLTACKLFLVKLVQKRKNVQISF